MDIIKADTSMAEAVRNIVRTTINAIYPHYYPAGAVRFFLEHHSDEKIISDIRAGKVWLLLTDEDVPAGTVTVDGNDIGRLFVLPGYQGKGFGGKLLRFAEEKVFAEYDEAVLDSSLPAKQIYLKKGYIPQDYHIIDAFGDQLCFDSMLKKKEDLESGLL